MEEKRLRFWENIVVFLGLALFVREAITMLNRRFDSDYNQILSYGADYESLNLYHIEFDSIMNLTFPIASVSLFTYLAWFVFHNYAYPSLNKNPEKPLGYVILIGVFILVFVGVLIYQQYKLSWRLSTVSGDFPDIFEFYKSTRKNELFANTVFVIWLIFLYEVISEAFYSFTNAMRKEGTMYGLFINFLFGIFILVFLLTLGKLGESFPKPSDFNEPLPLLILGTPIFLSQNVFYKSLKNWLGVSRLFSSIFFVIAIGFFSSLILNVCETAYRLPHVSTLERINYRFSEISVYALISATIAISIGIVRFLFYLQRNKLQTAVTVKSAELDQLRAQVNPHFLFNALNTLYSVSLKENAETTAVGIQKLGDMMRFMLNENYLEQIPLSKEIEQLENYIEIQRMRLDENFKVEVNLQKPQKEIYIAPMLLNPFVENAFKHGISFRNVSWIYVTLTFDEKALYFKVHNSLHKTPELDPEKYSNGIGLENVKKRLELLYPNKHKLLIQTSEQDYFINLSLEY